jgi:ATP-dependent Clp protease ATP-binding subunit ClpA
MLTPDLEATLSRSLEHANWRRHEFATLEHLLLALLDDPDAASALRSRHADLDRLRQKIIDYLNTKLTHIVSRDLESKAKPTAGFQRSLQRAAIQVQSGGGGSVNGSHLLIALLSERESHAATFITEEGVTRGELLGVPADPREN